MAPVVESERQASRDRLQIGDLTLSSGSQQVFRDGAEIHLPRLSFAMLETLARHAPDVVAFECLVAEVWQGVAISDGTIFQRIKLLRQALGDDSEQPRYIASVRGRGYRLIPPVERPPPSTSENWQPEVATVASKGSARRRAVWIGLALALVTFALLSLRRPKESPQPTPRRIAVLPIAALGGDDESEALASGMTEQLTSALSQGEGLRVLASTSVMSYQGSQMRARDLGLELGVDLLLEGSLRVVADQIRISVKAIDVLSEELIWARDYEDLRENALSLQTEAARHVAIHLGTAIADDTRMRREDLSVDDLRAFEFFRKGRASYVAYLRQDNERAIEFFQRALEIDPDFALARAWLANAYVQRTQRYGMPPEWAARAMDEATQALQLEPNLPEAYKAQGIAHSVQGRWKSALVAYERALELRPVYGAVLYNVAILQASQGRYDLAFRRLLDLIRWDSTTATVLAVADLLQGLDLSSEAEPFLDHVLQVDPLAPGVQETLARRDLRSGDLDSAIARLDKALSLDPRRSRSLQWAGRAALLVGRFEDSIARAQTLLEISESDVDAKLLLASAFQRQGRVQTAEALFQEIAAADLSALDRGADDWAPHWRLSAIAAWRGQHDEALEHYRRAIGAGYLVHWWDRFEPAFVGLSEDSRFKEALQELDSELVTMRRRVIEDGLYDKAISELARRPSSP